MSESKFKLTYFTVRGVAEAIRYLFAYAEVDFEDNRIAQDQWPLIKEKIYASMRKTTPDAKKELDDAVEFLLKKLEPLAADGFFYGEKKPTWVDIYFTGIFEGLDGHLPGVLKEYPNLIAIGEKIKNTASVKKYIENRPADNWVHAVDHAK